MQTRNVNCRKEPGQPIPRLEERHYEAKRSALRAAIDEGDGSGVAEGDVFTQVRATLNLPANPSSLR
jgi:hypothetical protein